MILVYDTKERFLKSDSTDSIKRITRTARGTFTIGIKSDCVADDGPFVVLAHATDLKDNGDCADRFVDDVRAILLGRSVCFIIFSGGGGVKTMLDGAGLMSATLETDPFVYLHDLPFDNLEETFISRVFTFAQHLAKRNGNAPNWDMFKQEPWAARADRFVADVINADNIKAFLDVYETIGGTPFANISDDILGQTKTDAEHIWQSLKAYYLDVSEANAKAVVNACNAFSITRKAGSGA